MPLRWRHCRGRSGPRWQRLPFADALRQLSREHHHALTMGRDLRRAQSLELAGRFLEFWPRQCAIHFRIEEEVLLPMRGLLGTVEAEAAARLAHEHRQICTAALALADRPSVAAEPGA